MTPELASKLYDYSCYGIIIGLAIGFISTGISIYSSNIINDDLKLKLSMSHERTEQLKKELSWRRLSEEQYKTLVDKLRPYPSTILITNPPEIEATTFANDFVKAFADAGWKVEHSPYFWYAVLEYGISVSRTENGESERLTNLLSSIKIEHKLDAIKDKFTLFIGSKEPPNIN